ncbi:MAG TPA: hypothetical protein VM818_24720 [Vicinamibacterales bacterium]|nr:hypothetical protein [Vicinamibacterales bacterium]
MRRLRRHLSAIAAIWLVSQLGVLTGVPVLLATGYAAEGEEVLCTCAVLGPGHFCPMHGVSGHHGGVSSDTDREPPDCFLNSPVVPSAVPLFSLLNGLAPLPPLPAPPASAADHERIASMSRLPILRPASPELPPPR